MLMMCGMKTKYGVHNHYNNFSSSIVVMKKDNENEKERDAVMTENTLYPAYVEPKNSDRAIPLWFWKGKRNKEELIRQIHVFKEMGFGGFFMHSRTALVREYLGDEWFDLINACAEEAENLGMEA